MGANYFSKMSHTYANVKGADLGKIVCICFVISETCDIYWERYGVNAQSKWDWIRASEADLGMLQHPSGALCDGS